MRDDDQLSGGRPTPDVEYELHVERVRRRQEANVVALWQDRGWEVVSRSDGESVWAEVVFRRMRPARGLMPRIDKVVAA